MTQRFPRQIVLKAALFLTVLGLTWVVSSDPARSDLLNSRTRPYTGYTRPGTPDDRVEGGKIIWAANVDKGVL